MKTIPALNLPPVKLNGNNLKKLLIVSAVIEAAVGLFLLVFPSLIARLLLGSPLETNVALVVAQVAGVALLALGVACWLASQDWGSRAARGLVSAMLVYNGGIALVLVFAGTRSGLSGIGLWSVAILHTVMAIWCIAGLLIKPA